MDVRRGALIGLAALAGVARVAPVEPPATGGPPFALAGFEPMDRTGYTAVVDEVLDAGAYAYLRLGDQWHATLDDGVQAGELVRVVPFGRIRDWRSARLDRPLGDVVFAAVDRAQSSNRQP